MLVAVLVSVLAACTTSTGAPIAAVSTEQRGPTGTVPGGLDRFYAQSLTWGDCARFARNDDDAAALVHLKASVLEAEAGGVGPTANGDEDDISFQLSGKQEISLRSLYRASDIGLVSASWQPTVSGLPPLAESTSSLIFWPEASPLTTLVPSLKSMPCFFSSF